LSRGIESTQSVLTHLSVRSRTKTPDVWKQMRSSAAFLCALSHSAMPVERGD